MGSDLEPFIVDVIEMSQRVISEFRSTLAALGLDADVPQVSRSPHGVEIVSYVRRQGDIEDAIEFAAVENDRVTYSVRELEKWLRNALDDVVRRAVEGA